MNGDGVPTERRRDNNIDGGWGWVVCIACFSVHVLTDGLFYSFGILFAELLRFFNESIAGTAWILSIFQGVTMGEGPLIAILINHVGCRVTSVIGTILLAGGYLTSMFAPNIYLLYFTIGIMAGCGNGLLYFSAVVCVSEYFDEKRSLATGIGVSGSGIGMFIFGPITALLIGTYTWKGALLIQSGIVLNGIACALIFRPLKRDRDTPTSVFTDTNTVTDSNINDLTEHAEITTDTNMSGSTMQIMHLSAAAFKNDKEESHESMKSQSEEADQVLKDDLLFEQREPFLHDLELDSGSDKQSNHKKSEGACTLTLMKIIPFDLFVLSSFIGSFGFYAPYIFLPDKAREQGIDPDRTSWLVAAIGITNTGSRVVFGYLADKDYVNRRLLYAIALIIYGCATAFVPLCNSFELLICYAVIFGSFSGSSVCLRSVLLADIVGINNLANAFGICNFFTGITVFVGPPLAGWLADITGSYTLTFITGGTTLIISGALIFFIPCCDNTNKVINLL